MDTYANEETRLEYAVTLPIPDLQSRPELIVQIVGRTRQPSGEFATLFRVDAVPPEGGVLAHTDELVQPRVPRLHLDLWLVSRGLGEVDLDLGVILGPENLGRGRSLRRSLFRLLFFGLCSLRSLGS